MGASTVPPEGKTQWSRTFFIIDHDKKPGKEGFTFDTVHKMYVTESISVVGYLHHDNTRYKVVFLSFVHESPIL